MKAQPLKHEAGDGKQGKCAWTVTLPTRPSSFLGLYYFIFLVQYYRMFIYIFCDGKTYIIKFVISLLSVFFFFFIIS